MRILEGTNQIQRVIIARHLPEAHAAGASTGASESGRGARRR